MAVIVYRKQQDIERPRSSNRPGREGQLLFSRAGQRRDPIRPFNRESQMSISCAITFINRSAIRCDTQQQYPFQLCPSPATLLHIASVYYYSDGYDLLPLPPARRHFTSCPQFSDLNWLPSCVESSGTSKWRGICIYIPTPIRFRCWTPTIKTQHVPCGVVMVNIYEDQLKQMLGLAPA